MRARLLSFMPWAVILSEVSHVFCCVLPTLFSAMTLLAGLGLISMVPTFVMDWHEAIHAYELPIIAMSGIITVLAWVIYMQADRVDCHDTGCGHPPCTPRKARAGRVLKIGTVLFAVNLFIFLFLHYLPEKGVYSLGQVTQEAGHDAGHDAGQGAAGHHDHDHGHHH